MWDMWLSLHSDYNLLEYGKLLKTFIMFLSCVTLWEKILSTIFKNEIFSSSELSFIFLETFVLKVIPPFYVKKLNLGKLAEDSRFYTQEV